MTHSTPSTTPPIPSDLTPTGEPAFTVRHERDPVWEDGPLLFTAQDDLGVLYLCMAVGRGDHTDPHLCAVTTPDELRALIREEMHLDAYLAMPARRLSFGYLAMGEGGDPFALNLTPIVSAPESWLPFRYFPFRNCLRGEFGCALVNELRAQGGSAAKDISKEQ